MNVLRSAIMALSCFSKVPMPHVEWHERNMRFMICFFPLVGIVIGLLLAAWTWLSNALGFGSVAYAAGLALVPLVVTGGIHLDGFCDVVDAQSSHAEPKRKREILKDPHAGAFASIAMSAYLVAYVAFATELHPTWHVVALLGGMHVASRCMSGIASKAFPLNASQGMLSMEHGQGVDRTSVVVLVITLIAVAAFMLWVDVLAGSAMICVGLVCLALLLPFANTQFGGMSGDLAGFFLQVAELCMIIALVLVLKVVGS